MNSSNDLLSINEICVSYAERTIGTSNTLEVITFSLSGKTGLVALTGPNGSGKTTLLHAITGQLSINQGTILLSGIDVTTEPPHRRNGIACLFQKALDGMCDSLTIEENLSLMLMQNGPSLTRPLLDLHRRDRMLGRAQQILTSRGTASSLMVNLESLLNRYPTEFSGGELQQLCLLAILLQEPPALLVLADEPTLNLDKVNRKTCLDMLLTLSRTTTVLVATHDKDLIEQSSRVLRLEQGRLVKDIDHTGEIAHVTGDA